MAGWSNPRWGSLIGPDADTLRHIFESLSVWTQDPSFGPVGNPFVNGVGVIVEPALLKIKGDQIESSNFVSGGSGWQIKADGSAEFNNVTVRGTLATTSVSGNLTLIAGGKFRTASSGDRVEISTTMPGPIDPVVQWFKGADSAFILMDNNGLRFGSTSSKPFVIPRAQLQERPYVTGGMEIDGDLDVEAGTPLRLRSNTNDQEWYYKYGGNAVAHTFTDKSNVGFRWWGDTLGFDALAISNVGHVVTKKAGQNADHANASFRAESTDGGSACIALHIPGDCACTIELWNGDNQVHWKNNAGGYQRVNLDYFNPSAARLKQDLSDLGSVMEKIRTVKPKRFRYRRPVEDPVYQKWRQEVAEGVWSERATANLEAQWDQMRVGFTAEDIAPVFPEVVNFDPDGKPQGISYQLLTSVLWKAVQEMDEANEGLTERVEALEGAR